MLPRHRRGHQQWKKWFVSVPSAGSVRDRLRLSRGIREIRAKKVFLPEGPSRFCFAGTSPQSKKYSSLRPLCLCGEFVF